MQKLYSSLLLLVMLSVPQGFADVTDDILAEVTTQICVNSTTTDINPLYCLILVDIGIRNVQWELP